MSTDQLFGTYREPPVIKEKKKEYNPNFDNLNISPEQRRYLEVFGTERPPNNAFKEEKRKMNLEISETNGDAFSKKVNSIYILLFHLKYIFNILSGLDSNIFHNEAKRPQTTKAEKPKEKLYELFK